MVEGGGRGLLLVFLENGEAPGRRLYLGLGSQARRIIDEARMRRGLGGL